MSRTRLGFTLIEILVVVAVIGTLAALATFAYTDSQQKGRDSKRKQELKATSGALRLYYDDNQKYPDPDGPGGSELISNSDTADWIPGLAPDYIKSLPKDPKKSSISSYFASTFNLFDKQKKGKAAGQIAAATTSQFIGLGGGGFEVATLISGTRLLTAVECGGIRMSDDGGETWSEASKGIPGYGTVQRLWKDPYHPNTIFVGRTNDILKSTDNGNSWLVVNNVKGVPFADFAATDSSTYYVVEGDRRRMYEGSGPWGSRAKIWKSINGGTSWGLVPDAALGSQVATNSTDDLPSIYIHPTSKDIYVAASTGGVRKSIDGGKNWADFNQGLTELNSHRLIASANNPNILFFTTGNPSKVFKRDLSGGDWILITQVGLPTTSNLFDMAVKSDGTLYVANFNTTADKGGIYRLDGASWTYLTNNAQNDLEHGWMADVVSWSKYPSGAAISIDPNDENIMYFTTPFRDQIFKTIDSGANWKQRSAILANIGETNPALKLWKNRGMALVGAYAIAIDPNNSNKIFLGYADWTTAVSEDGGTNWRRVSVVPGVSYSDVNKILIDPVNSNNIWHAAGHQETASKYGVYYSSDGGTNWTAIGGTTGTTSNVNNLPAGYVYDIAIDPTTPAGSRSVYVVVDGQGVYERIGQNNWTNMGLTQAQTDAANRSTRTVAIDPGGGTRPKAIYVGFGKKGTGTGSVWKATNSGSGWSGWSEVAGTSGRNVSRGMYVNPNTGDLYFGTGNPAGGLYRWKYGTAVATKLSTDNGIQGIHLVPGTTGNPDVVYASGELNPLFKWVDSGGSGVVTTLMDRLPANVFAYGFGVAYDKNSDTLYASMQCAGVYKIPAVSLPIPTPTPTSSTAPSSGPSTGPSTAPSSSPSTSPPTAPSSGPSSSPGSDSSAPSGPAPSPYYYVVASDFQSFVLWAKLENAKDPQTYNKPDALCTDIPPAGADVNYCVKST